MDLLNSPLANALVKYAFKNWGWVARRAGLLFAAWLTHKNVFPAGDIESFQLTFTAFVTMLGAIGYGLLDFWITNRQKTGVKAMQAAINKSDTDVTVKVDGVAGNESISAAAAVADVPVASVIATAKQS